MKNVKRILALSLAGCMMAGALAGCADEGSSGNDNKGALTGDTSIDTSSVKATPHNCEVIENMI